jgi:hypothetical protein
MSTKTPDPEPVQAGEPVPDQEKAIRDAARRKDGAVVVKVTRPVFTSFQYPTGEVAPDGGPVFVLVSDQPTEVPADLAKDLVAAADRHGVDIAVVEGGEL